MKVPAAVWAQHLLPQKLLSRFTYRLARCPWPWVKTPLIRWFVSHYGVDLGEAESSDVAGYRTFNEFFTRPLRRGARPIAAGAQTIISPVDGELTQFGTLQEAVLLQAKGLSYRLEELLREERAAIRTLLDGSYATFYLAPHDYHRVHMPVAGVLRRTRYVPGRRFSVNAATARGIRRLFCRNERVICWFDTACGPMALALVGALNVSSIRTAWLGEIRSGAERVWSEDGGARRYGRGAEIARFNLGSTVILVLPRGALSWREDLVAPSALRLGEAIGTARPPAAGS
jgi:phosphatidylserine decarboxylase